jgi:hypothetical protein
MFQINKESIQYCLLFFLLLFMVSCNGQRNSKLDNNRIIDSVEIVAKYFLEFSDYYNSFVVSDRDIVELYQTHKNWVIKYFPRILDKYDLTLPSRFVIVCYLYLVGDKQYLQEFWLKYDSILQSIGRKDEFTNDMKYLGIQME